MYTFVSYWGVLGMYLKLLWMMGNPMMWTWSLRVMGLDIYDDALVIAHLQTIIFLIGLTPKEKNLLCIRPNGSNGKVIPSYMCG
jgi:hypothetical protein